MHIWSTVIVRHLGENVLRFLNLLRSFASRIWGPVFSLIRALLKARQNRFDSQNITIFDAMIRSIRPKIWCLEFYFTWRGSFLLDTGIQIQGVSFIRLYYFNNIFYVRTVATCAYTHSERKDRSQFDPINHWFPHCTSTYEEYIFYSSRNRAKQRPLFPPPASWSRDLLNIPYVGIGMNEKHSFMKTPRDVIDRLQRFPSLRLDCGSCGKAWSPRQPYSTQ